MRARWKGIYEILRAWFIPREIKELLKRAESLAQDGAIFETNLWLEQLGFWPKLNPFVVKEVERIRKFAYLVSCRKYLWQASNFLRAGCRKENAIHLNVAIIEAQTGKIFKEVKDELVQVEAAYREAFVP